MNFQNFEGKSLTAEDLHTLSQPFPEDVVGVKIQSVSKAKDQAMLVLYVQHTDVYGRLEEVDPSWESTVLNEQFYSDAGVYSVRMRMTVKGVSRENVGEGEDPKSAYSDALKRCAMLFGVGRYLYDSETVWVPYHEPRDKYRVWTMDDVKQHTRRKPNLQASSSGANSKKMTPPTDSAGVKPKTRSREELNRKILEIYKTFLELYPEVGIQQVLTERYNVKETKNLTVEQLEDFTTLMEKMIASPPKTTPKK